MDFSVINVCIIYISLLFFTYMSSDAYILYKKVYIYMFHIVCFFCVMCVMFSVSIDVIHI